MNDTLSTPTYTGRAFADALSAGSLKHAIVRVGMVKRNEDDAKKLLFSESGCGRWIEVPIEQIDAVKHLSTSKCEDHEHPLVEIRFKEPEDGAARLFADLARVGAVGAIGGQAMPIVDDVPGAVFRQRDDDAAGTTGTLLDDCRCIAYEWSYRVARIRIAPGRFIPVLIRTRGACSIYECSPR